jgi:hypothetical protein
MNTNLDCTVRAHVLGGHEGVEDGPVVVENWTGRPLVGQPKTEATGARGPITAAGRGRAAL